MPRAVASLLLLLTLAGCPTTSGPVDDDDTRDDDDTTAIDDDDCLRVTTGWPPGRGSRARWAPLAYHRRMIDPADHPSANEPPPAMPERHRIWEDRTGLIEGGTLTQQAARRALKRSAPTFGHAMELLDRVTELLGEGGGSTPTRSAAANRCIDATATG